MVITGASSGIGAAAAVALAGRGDEVVLVGRDPDRLRRVAEEVREASGRTPDTHRADFAVLDEVRALGETLSDRYPRVDVLANNAGLLAGRRTTTADGHELTIQVNHLAGFLLTHLLLDRLVAAAPARLITTASGSEASGRLDPADLSGARRRYSRWLAYGSSKQANILFTVEAARRWTDRGVIATSFHPGFVRTRWGSGSPLVALAKVLPYAGLSSEQGADTMIWLATEEAGLAQPGGYFQRRTPARPRAHSTDPVLAERLWEASLAAVGLPVAR